MKSKPHICLIGGSGRSGTTVLRRIFDRHPDVVSVPEFRITVDPGGLVDFFVSVSQNWSPFILDQRLKELEAVLRAASGSNFLSKYYRRLLKTSGMAGRGLKLEKKYTDIGISKYCRDYATLVEGLIQDLTDFVFDGSWTGQPFGSVNSVRFSSKYDAARLAERLGTFYRTLIRSVAERRRATHFVEDNTWNILHFHHLRELVPEARLIHIYRDPRDVIASYMQQSWAPSDPAQAAQFYLGIMNRWMEIKKRVPQHTLLEISLESLVESPESVLHSIIDFWELEWDESLLELELDKANRGRWKHDIPADQHRMVTEMVTEFLDYYGYES